jgi:hypothetical protein
MAIPVRVGSGTGVEDTAGAINVQKTSCTTGNIIILQVVLDGDSDLNGLTFNDTNDTVEALDGTDNTMTTITAPSQIGVSASSHWLYIGRSMVTGTVSIDVTTAGEDAYCRVYEFSGVHTGTALTDVIENASAGAFINGTGNSASVLDTTVTTLGADRLALNFIGVNDDSTAAYSSFTSETGGDWTLTDQFEASAGTDAAILLQTADMASAGTIDGGSMAMDSDPWGVIGFALIPPAAAGGTEDPFPFVGGGFYPVEG